MLHDLLVGRYAFRFRFMTMLVIMEWFAIDLAAHVLHYPWWVIFPVVALWGGAWINVASNLDAMRNIPAKVGTP